jgi:hemerythrin
MEVQNCSQLDWPFKTMHNDSPRLKRGKLAYDSRYRNIIGQLDGMFEQLLHQPDKDLKADFDRLLDSVMEHIGSENCYMGMVIFPQAVQHCLHHQFICTKMAELRHRISKRLEVQPEELGYIRLLWMEHIHVHDRVFEEFLES